jgi:hypothetical protein
MNFTEDIKRHFEDAGKWWNVKGEYVDPAEYVFS